jgi:FkbM family methyltransferase
MRNLLPHWRHGVILLTVTGIGILFLLGTKRMPMVAPMPGDTQATPAMVLAETSAELRSALRTSMSELSSKIDRLGQNKHQEMPSVPEVLHKLQKLIDLQTEFSPAMIEGWGLTHLMKSKVECTQKFWNDRLPPFGTNCPADHRWMAEMAALDGSPDKVILNIGCNKGNDVIQAMELWDPKGADATTKWFDYYETVLKSSHFVCPVTKTKKPGSQTTANGGRAPLGICVEAMPANAKALDTAAKELGYKMDSLKIIHAAASDKTVPGATVKFPDGAVGAETGSIGVGNVDVPLVTVDSLVSELALSKVDLLIIDTEGHDPAVIRGAEKTLPITRYITFEVHRDLTDTAWGKTSLASIIKLLDTHGFECYWAGNRGQLMNIQRCWSSQFEVGTWANVACVKRTDPWFHALDKLSY